MDSPRVSWALATWVVPVVPVVWFLVFTGLDVALGIGVTATGAYAWGTVLALSLAAAGAVLGRIGGAVVRGLGAGLLAGGVACTVPAVWVLVT